jgi:AraC-like DNA-binding protein
METILHALERFVGRRKVGTVHFAQPGSPPPELAYMVNFPRVSLTLTGCDVEELEQPGRTEALELKPGSAIVIPPNCWNRPRWSQPVTVLNLLAGQKQLGLSLVTHEGRGEAPSRTGKAVVSGAAANAERDLLQALLVVGRRPGALAAPAILDALLHSLLETLTTPTAAAPRKSAVTHEALCLHLQQNFAFPITRESVAAHFHLSTGHVSRLFRNEGLSGFSEYLNRVRIDRAKLLLRQHPLTLDEIASKCGYTDTAYFCRVFKQLTRLTPTAYRDPTKKG